MNRKVFFLIAFVFYYAIANAQKGGLIYYLKNSGKLVSKDSADYSMLVMPPDSTVDKNLYIVYQYYQNGKLMLLTGSKTNDLNLRYEGRYMSYYENGKRMKMGALQNGAPVGNETKFYPNGKLYSIINNTIDNSNDRYERGTYMQECRDSTGAVLAANGNGKWVEFDDDFKNIKQEGFVAHGVKDSTWVTWENGIIRRKETFDNGVLIMADNLDGLGPIAYSKFEKVPEFPGGMQAFGAFLGQNIRYPSVARENGTQGKVIISFVINTDGTTSDVKVVRGIGDGCDEEAVRVIKLMPRWLPGTLKGRPVRGAFGIPLNFSLTGK